MNFDFNDEQRAIKDAARDLLASRYPLAEVRRLATEDERGFTDGQWDELVSLGWPGIFVDESHGGQGLGVVELVILQEELGYALAPRRCSPTPPRAWRSRPAAATNRRSAG